MQDLEPGENAVAGLSQLRRGALEHCVLALLVAGPSYGFDLIKQLSTGRNLVASEGTIYPLLSRLRRNGFVTTHWATSDSGPPRRYYSITEEGTLALHGFVLGWGDFRDSVDLLFKSKGLV